MIYLSLNITFTIKINNNRLTVTPPDGKNITLSKPTFERLNNERRFSAEDHRHKVTIEVAKTVCLDQIKNRLYPDTVTLSIDDKKYTGCGGKPDFLLMEKNWAISSVGGKQINERSHLNLTFLPNGRITGDSGCNQFGGTYNLTQNGISISLLHITRKICINSLMQQEFNFLKLISKTSDYIVEEKNKLILKSGNGDIVAYSRDD
jgi:heat shock protein HslJ